MNSLLRPNADGYIRDHLTSNSVWKDGQIYPNYREPFAAIALMRAEAETKQAVSCEENGLRLVGRDFIASFRNFCLDPPVEMRLILNELHQLKKLVGAVSR